MRSGHPVAPGEPAATPIRPGEPPLIILNFYYSPRLRSVPKHRCRRIQWQRTGTANSIVRGCHQQQVNYEMGVAPPPLSIAITASMSQRSPIC